MLYELKKNLKTNFMHKSAKSAPRNTRNPLFSHFEDTLFANLTI